MDDAEARDRILAAAERLYYAKGYGAVGMDELRTTAGVSLRRLYGLYPSKGNIITSVLDRKRAEWEAALREAIDAAGENPHARLLAVYAHLERWFCTDDFRGCAFINAYGELGGTDPEVAQVVRDHKAAFQAQMTELAVAAGAPGSLGRQLAILAEGAQTTAAIGADPQAAHEARVAAQTLIEAHLRGAKTSRPSGQARLRS